MTHMQEKMPKGPSQRGKREAGILFVLCFVLYETRSGKDAKGFEKGGWDSVCVVVLCCC